MGERRRLWRINFKNALNGKGLFLKAKTLRENADYYGDFTKTSAEDLIKKAEEFLGKTKEILKIK